MVPIVALALTTLGRLSVVGVLPRLATEGMEGKEASDMFTLPGDPNGYELSWSMNRTESSPESGAVKSDFTLRVLGGAGLLDIGMGLMGSVGDVKSNWLFGGVSGVITLSVSRRLCSTMTDCSCRLCWEARLCLGLLLGLWGDF